MTARVSIEHGAAHPYDRNEDGSFEPARDWAHVAARGVFADLTDRRGIGNELEEVDPEIRREIVENIAAIIREVGRG